MAWEWVAPTVAGASGAVGVFFTWFAGAQARAHTERMVSKARDEELRVWRLKERRDAYLNALKVIELDLRRQRYERQAKREKLAEVDKFWPKGQRVQMGMEAIIGVQIFGSAETRKLAEAWRIVSENNDYDGQIELADKIRRQIRVELSPEETGVQLSRSRRTSTSKAPGTSEGLHIRNDTSEDHCSEPMTNILPGREAMRTAD